MSLPELVEAAVRSGRPQVAGDALQRLSERTCAAGTEFALGIEARSRALLRYWRAIRLGNGSLDIATGEDEHWR